MGCLDSVYDMALWDYHYAVKGWSGGQGEKPEPNYPTDQEFEETLRMHGMLH